jgi:mannose/fructose-specific phosphotransferase system component IIA
MSEPLHGVIVSHAAVAQALLAAVAAITGVSDALVPVSNDGCDTGALTERLTRAIDGGPAVLFVDLPGGSCLTSSVRLARGRTDVAVVTGVNLAMLLDFVFHRDLPPADAARRAAEAGSRAIRTPAA